jgi:PBSX family phage terminase large subunit
MKAKRQRRESKPQTVGKSIHQLSALKELNRRIAAEQETALVIKNLKELAFPAQLEFSRVFASTTYLVANCTRAASKTWSAVRDILVYLLENADCRALALYMTKDLLTRDAFDAAKRMLETAGYTGSGVKRQFPIKFENGSEFLGYGIDSAAYQPSRIRGMWVDRVMIDEGQSFRNDLEKIIDIITPAMARRPNSKLVILCTPGDVLNTWLHKIVDGRIPGYTVMKWHWRENPHVVSSMQKLIEDRCKLIPDYKETATYMREFEGEWVIEDEMRVYRFGPQNLDVDELPINHHGYIYGLGGDLGQNDDNALALVCYPRIGPRCLYIVDVWHDSLKNDPTNKLDLVAYSQLFMKWKNDNNAVHTAIDGANLQALESLRSRNGLIANPAKKLGKWEHIKMLNAEMERGNVKILKRARKTLTEEWSNLTKDRRAMEAGKFAENTKADNHVSDAVLYIFFACYDYLTKSEEQIHQEELEAVRRKHFAGIKMIPDQAQSPGMMSFKEAKEADARTEALLNAEHIRKLASQNSPSNRNYYGKTWK